MENGNGEVPVWLKTCLSLIHSLRFGMLIVGMILAFILWYQFQFMNIGMGIFGVLLIVYISPLWIAAFVVSSGYLKRNLLKLLEVQPVPTNFISGVRLMPTFSFIVAIVLVCLVILLIYLTSFLLNDSITYSARQEETRVRIDREYNEYMGTFRR